MPIAALSSLAARAGVPRVTAERFWRQKKRQLKPQSGVDRGKHSYRYLMGTIKRMLANKAKS